MIQQPAVLLVPHHVGLVDRLDRAQSHRHGRELPVIGHQPGVRIGGKATTVYFTAEIVELLLAEAALQIGARVHPGRTVTLEKHQVTTRILAVAAKEIIEAHVIERGTGQKGRDMSAEPLVIIIGAHHHRQRVPANQRAYAALDEQIARHAVFGFGRNGVAIRSGDCRRHLHAAIGCPIDEALEQVGGTPLASIVRYRIERIEPLSCFRRIDILLHENSPAICGIGRAVNVNRSVIVNRLQ